MKLAKIIDQTRCIGCHACTTACKSENEVPIGVDRTRVKYVETGAFPNTRRHFQVTRCNQCEHPPCVYICPVTAMYQRPDGIGLHRVPRLHGCLPVRCHLHRSGNAQRGQVSFLRSPDRAESSARVRRRVSRRGDHRRRSRGPRKRRLEAHSARERRGSKARARYATQALLHWRNQRRAQTRGGSPSGWRYLHVVEPASRRRDGGPGCWHGGLGDRCL
jgi:ferredoxin